MVGFGGVWIAPHVDKWQWPKAPMVFCLHFAQRHHWIGGLYAVPNSWVGPGPVSVGAGYTSILWRRLQEVQYTRPAPSGCRSSFGISNGNKPFHFKILKGQQPTPIAGTPFASEPLADAIFKESREIIWNINQIIFQFLIVLLFLSNNTSICNDILRNLFN